jgi:hypothetical protein
MTSKDKVLYAYELSATYTDMPISAAPFTRDWMDASPDRFAYRCLPLTIANQGGWVLPNPDPFTAVWDGGAYPDSLQIEVEIPANDPGEDGASVERPIVVASHFGSGIITFSLPYLFRTPPSVNLWVKGPSNWIKDGVQPLEGVVETDWLTATFTMNWKLTRPNHPVRFEEGEPICMIVPVARGLAEQLQPVYTPITREPELHEEFKMWSRRRAEFNQALDEMQPDAVRQGWQKDYNKGIKPNGARVRQHQTRLHLKEFARAEGAVQTDNVRPDQPAQAGREGRGE